jgi:hypothetical protein
VSRVILHRGGRGPGKEIIEGRRRAPIVAFIAFNQNRTHAQSSATSETYVGRCGKAVPRSAAIGGKRFIADPLYPLCLACVADIESEVRK